MTDILDRSLRYQTQTDFLVGFEGATIGIGLLFASFYLFKWWRTKRPSELPTAEESTDSKRRRQILSESKTGLAMSVMIMSIGLLLLLAELEWLGYNEVFNNGVRRTVTRFCFLGVMMFTFYRVADLMYRSIQSPRVRNLENNGCGGFFITSGMLQLICLWNVPVLLVSVVVFFSAMILYDNAPTLETAWAPAMVIVDGVTFLMNLSVIIILLTIQLNNLREGVKYTAMYFYFIGLASEALVGGVTSAVIAWVGLDQGSYDPNLYRFQAASSTYPAQATRLGIESLLLVYLFDVYIFDIIIHGLHMCGDYSDKELDADAAAEEKEYAEFAKTQKRQSAPPPPSEIAVRLRTPPQAAVVASRQSPETVPLMARREEDDDVANVGVSDDAGEEGSGEDEEDENPEDVNVGEGGEEQGDDE